MADQRNQPSSSDDSDDDFKPSDEESLPSEEDSDGSVEELPLENVEEQNNSKKKRKRKQTKLRNKIKKKDDSNDDNEDIQESKKEIKQLTKEEEKKKMDSLWSDFLKDSSPPIKKTSVPDVDSGPGVEAKESPIRASKPEKENKAIVKEIFEFAGEKVEVEKVVPALPAGRGRGRGALMSGRGRGAAKGGLSALVGQLGKKNKLSTLEKSKLDWEAFKKKEGIDEELQSHNKGKEGYLDKQDFLQRADLRQFAIEKQLRSTSRSNR